MIALDRCVRFSPVTLSCSFIQTKTFMIHHRVPRCNLLRFDGTTLWLRKTVWKETHITQGPNDEQGYHAAFKTWVYREWRRLAFRFLFHKKTKNKKKIQKGGEGRTEAPLKQPKYIHASAWFEFLLLCCRVAALSCPRCYISVPRASLAGVSLDGLQVI